MLIVLLKSILSNNSFDRSDLGIQLWCQERCLEPICTYVRCFGCENEGGWRIFKEEGVVSGDRASLRGIIEAVSALDVLKFCLLSSSEFYGANLASRFRQINYKTVLEV